MINRRSFRTTPACSCRNHPGHCAYGAHQFIITDTKEIGGRQTNGHYSSPRRLCRKQRNNGPCPVFRNKRPITPTHHPSPTSPPNQEPVFSPIPPQQLSCRVRHIDLDRASEAQPILPPLWPHDPSERSDDQTRNHTSQCPFCQCEDRETTHVSQKDCLHFTMEQSLFELCSHHHNQPLSCMLFHCKLSLQKTTFASQHNKHDRNDHTNHHHVGDLIDAHVVTAIIFSFASARMSGNSQQPTARARARPTSA